MMTGMFKYLAHPDLCFRSYKAWDDDCVAVSRDLCRCARETGMPLEYNLLGVRYTAQGASSGLGYPCSKFWEVAAAEDVTCIIGIEIDAFDKAADYLAGLGIERVEKLEFGK